MEWWMIVQIIICVALILAVIFQPRKAGMGGGMFGGMTRADRSSKFRSLPVLSKLTVVLGAAFLIFSFLFSFLLT